MSRITHCSYTHTFVCIHTYILTYIIIIIIIVNCILTASATAQTRQVVGKAVSLHAFHLFSSNSLTHTHSHGYFLIQPLNLTSKKCNLTNQVDKTNLANYKKKRKLNGLYYKQKNKKQNKKKLSFLIVQIQQRKNTKNLAK